MLRFKEADRPSFVELAKIITPGLSLPQFVVSPKGVPNELQPIGKSFGALSPSNLAGPGGVAAGIAAANAKTSAQIQPVN